MAATGWKRPFDDPIPLPRGRQLVTLEDAGTYITKVTEGRARGSGMAAVTSNRGRQSSQPFEML
jgi:hypothetical protein